MDVILEDVLMVGKLLLIIEGEILRDNDGGEVLGEFGTLL